jgi:arsenical pump membrane protein
VTAYLGLMVLVAVVAWRPHGWGPPLGALGAVAVAALGGALHLDDARRAAETLWRPFVTLLSIMTITATAERLGLLERIAAMIEPRTRGPVRHAFRLTFVLSAVVAAALSNDAAILLLTPVVLTLIRTVYPRRHPKFEVPFAFAVFAAAGVAPLVISNPMNLVVAEHAGIGFNRYAATMIPVALAGWVVAYAALAWIFRAELADQDPAIGAWPAPPPRLGAGARVVLLVLAVVLVAYPIASALDGPLWLVAATGAAACVVVAVRAGVAPRALAGAVTWSVFPFLLGVFVLAVGLERAGLVDRLAELYAGDAPLATIGAVSALGSAVLNNHPMAILNILALDQTGAPDSHVLAALIGGDLGPRLLPIGSLAGLLWIEAIRRHGLHVGVVTFVRIGALVTVPALAVSLFVLWLLS